MKFSSYYVWALIAGCSINSHATGVDGDKKFKVSQLRDVEIVGVKQMPDKELEARTVIDTTQLQVLNIVSLKGVSEITPNFYIPSYGSRMTSSIYVRGIGSRIDQPVVGFNIDNVPYINKDNFDLDMVDIDRIEVLRGTRSVLNGRNAMAGQVNIYTLSPWKYRGLRAVAEYGRGNTARASVGWYGLISSRLATSLSGWVTTTDGFYRNEYDNSHVGKDFTANGRWKLSWHPGSRWSLANTASISYGKQDGYPYENLATGKISYNDTAYYRRTSFTDGLTVSYTGDRMIATSVTSLQYLDDDMTLDQDFMPVDYFTLTQRRKEWAWTQDLFAKGTRDNYDWLLGVFGFYKSTDMSAPVTFKDAGIANLIEGNINGQLPPGMMLKFDERRMLLGSDFDIRDGGFALYHQSTLRLGKWTLKGGLRWDMERVKLHYHSLARTKCTMYRTLPTGVQMPMMTVPVEVDESDDLGHTYNEILPQVSVNFNAAPGINLYASVAKGYKAGGFNTQMFSDILLQQMMAAMGHATEYDPDEMMSYRPEKAWTYEVGTNMNLLDNKLFLQAVGYWMACRDQQLTVFPEGQTTGRAMTNAGRTRSIGAELSVSWRPLERLSFNASYGYTHAIFTNYNDGKEDLKGKRVPYAPSNTMFLSAGYRLPIEFAGITPSVDVSTRGVGNIFWDDSNTVSQKFYATLNASLTFNHRLGTLTLWGDNLTDTRYNTFYFVSIGNTFVQRARPWTAGVTLRLNISLL